jgi:hypothetical protein
MKIKPTLPLAVVAALGAGLYAAALLSDTAQADPRAAVVVNFPSASNKPQEAAVPGPRECKLDGGVDTACTFN